MPEGQVLEFTRVTKRFGDVTAVSDLSARVEPGVVTGFLGPNGAGKTTSLRMLLGQIRPTMGTATIGGKAYSELRHPLRTVGSLLEDTVYRPRRTATRQLTILAKANGIPLSRVDEVLRLVGLQNDAETRIGGFSLGMRQRLSVATALLGDPGALVLDEPANGLDPEGIRWMRMLMRRLADEGRTVLVSSHVLSEIEQVADNVVVLSRGRAEYTGSIEDLVDPTTGSVVVDAEDRSALAAALTASGLGYDVLRSGLTVRGADAARVGAIAAGAGIALTTLLQRGPSLEEVFLDLVYGRRSASPRLNEVANPVAHAAGALAADASLPTEVAALVDGADADTAASEGSDADADADAAALPLGDAALLASGAAVVGAAGVVGAGVPAAADSADGVSADADAAGGEATDAASESAAVASSDEAGADSAEQTSEPEAADQTDENASTDDADASEQGAAATTSEETPSSDDVTSSDEAAQSEDVQSDETQSDEAQSDEAQPEDADGDDATRVLTLPEVAGDDDEGANEDGAEVLPLATMAVSLAPEAERLTFTELITGVRATDSESTAEAAPDDAATEGAESDEDEAPATETAADAAGVEIFSPLLDSDEDADGSVDDQEQDDPRLAAMRTSLSAAAHAYFEAPAPAYPYGEVDREEQEPRTWTVATTGVIDTVPTAADAGSDSSDQADAAEQADDDQQDQAGEEDADDNGGEHEHDGDEPRQHEGAEHESSEHENSEHDHADHEHSGHERRERREHEQREHEHGGAEHHGDEHGNHQHHDGEATHDGEAAHDDNADDHSDNHAHDDGSGEHHSEHNEHHSEHEHEARSDAHDHEHHDGEHEHHDGEHDHQGGEHTGEHGHHEHHDGDHHEHHNHEHHN